MEELMKWAKDILSQFSFDFVLFIAGAFGAMVGDSRLEIELSKKQRALRMIVGGITAVFSTHLTVELLEHFFNIDLSKGASAGIGFYFGQLGLQGITRLMLRYSKRKDGK